MPGEKTKSKKTLLKKRGKEKTGTTNGEKRHRISIQDPITTGKKSSCEGERKHKSMGGQKGIVRSRGGAGHE